MPFGRGYGRRRRFRRRVRKMRRFRRFARGIRIGRRGFYPGWRNFNGNRAELKYIDASFGATTIGATAPTTIFQCMNLIAEGSGVSERIGRQVVIRKLQASWGACWAGTDVTGVDCAAMRVIILYDRMNNATAMDYATLAPLLWQSAATVGAAIHSPLNLSNRNRFKVLKDKRFIMGPTTGGAGTVYRQWIIKKRIKCTWGTTAGTVAAINTNAIHFVMINDGATATEGISVKGYVRARYTDV